MTDDQLSRAQLTGFLLLGLCVWAFLAGVVYAIVAERFPGLVVAVAGLIGIYILIKWLIFINKPKE